MQCTSEYAADSILTETERMTAMLVVAAVYWLLSRAHRTVTLVIKFSIAFYVVLDDESGAAERWRERIVWESRVLESTSDAPHIDSYAVRILRFGFRLSSFWLSGSIRGWRCTSNFALQIDVFFRNRTNDRILKINHSAHSAFNHIYLILNWEQHIHISPIQRRELEHNTVCK